MDENQILEQIKLLDSSEVSVRANAAAALGPLRDGRAVEPLIRLLDDKSIWVRCSAADALGIIGDSRAVAPLVNALRLPLTAHRSEHDADFSRWLQERGYGDLANVAFNLRDSAEKALTMISAPGVEQLIMYLDDEDSYVRSVVVRVLGKIGGARTAETLITILGDEEVEVRRNVAESLGKVGNVAAVDPLLTALDDEDDRVRRAAIKSLGWIMDERAVEPLIDVLKEAKGRMCAVAAEALGRLGDTRAVEALAAIPGRVDDLESEWFDERLKQIEAAQIEDAAIVETIIARMWETENPYKRAREAAHEALRKLGYGPDAMPG